MLCGRTPHDRVDVFARLLVAIANKNPERLERRAPWVDPELANVVHKALALDRAQRFQSAKEMLDALSPFAGSEGLRQSDLVAPSDAELGAASPETAPHTAPTVGLDEPPEDETAEAGGATEIGLTRTGTHPRPVRRSAWLAAGVGVSLLVGLGIWRSGSLSQPEPSTSAPVPMAEAPTTSTQPPKSAPTPSATREQREVVIPVQPATASVTVDGKPAVLTAEGLVLKGPLGATYIVELTHAGRTLKRSVAITDTGAMPARLDLVGTQSTAAKPRAPATPKEKVKPEVPKPTVPPAASSPGTLAPVRVFE